MFCFSLKKQQATFLLLLLCNIFLRKCVRTFNINVKDFELFKVDQPNSYFGYAVALAEATAISKKWVLVGAPRANDNTYKTGITEPGALFSCSLTESGNPDCNIVRGEAGDSVKPNYAVNHQKHNGWLGASVVATEIKQIAYCSHRWVNAFNDSTHNMNGLCYEIGVTLQRPPEQYACLSDPSMQYTNNIPDMSFGALGMSIAAFMDGTLLFGAPGLNDEFGGCVYLSNADNPIVYRSDWDKSRLGDMFGYSVAVGKFLSDKDEIIALGGPRAGLTGQVKLAEKASDGSIIVKALLQGEQIGSYFGSTVCSTKLKKDDLEQLLVGAPMYTWYEKGQTEVNEVGCVYIYAANDANEMELQKTLFGSKTKNARFGSAIAAIGDINHDTFYDIAVGAPYENEGKGAVYIFNGFRGGFWSKYSQKIEGSSFGPGITTFGSSISDYKREFYMNTDKFGDIVVGAFKSSSAFLLYSHPVVTLKSKIIFSLSNVIPKNTPTFNYRVCFSYSDDQGPQDLTLNYTVSMDTNAAREGKFSRVVYLGTKQSTKTDVKTLFSALNEQCDEKPVEVQVISFDEDIFTPIEFKIKYIVVSIGSTAFPIQPIVSEFDGNLANPEQPIASSQVELYREGCGPDNQCQSDLSLNFDVDLSGESTLFIGPKSTFMLNVDVINEGPDWAYATSVNIKLREDVYFHQINTESSNNKVACSPIGDKVMCSIFKPVKNGERFSFIVDFDSSNSRIEDLPIEVVVKSISDDMQLNNNEQKRNIPIATKANLALLGVSVPELYKTKEDATSNIDVLQKFDFTNNGPSHLQTTRFTIKFPTVIVDSKIIYAVHRMKIKTFSSSNINVTCSAANTNTASFKLHTVTLNDGETELMISNITYSENTVVESDCAAGACQSVVCDLSTVPSGHTVSVNLTSSMATDLYNIVKKSVAADLENVQLISQLVVGLPENQKLEDNLDDNTKSATLFVYPKELVSGKGLAWWIILLVVLGSLLILAAIVFVCWKCGFFRRKAQEDLEKLRKKNLSSKDQEKEPLTGKEEEEKKPTPEKNDGTEHSKEEKKSLLEDEANLQNLP